MLLLFQQDAANPITLVQEYGPAIGAVILCAGLFIWNSIQINNTNRLIEENSNAIEENSTAITANNTELKNVLEGHMQAQREIAQSVHQLAEAIHHQAETASEQIALVREMAGKQDVLMAGQTTIMINFQRVVEQLIDIVKKG